MTNVAFFLLFASLIQVQLVSALSLDSDDVVEGSAADLSSDTQSAVRTNSIDSGSGADPVISSCDDDEDSSSSGCAPSNMRQNVTVPSTVPPVSSKHSHWMRLELLVLNGAKSDSETKAAEAEPLLRQVLSIDQMDDQIELQVSAIRRLVTAGANNAEQWVVEVRADAGPIVEGQVSQLLLKIASERNKVLHNSTFMLEFACYSTSYALNSWPPRTVSALDGCDSQLVQPSVTGYMQSLLAQRIVIAETTTVLSSTTMDTDYGEYDYDYGEVNGSAIEPPPADTTTASVSTLAAKPTMTSVLPASSAPNVIDDTENGGDEMVSSAAPDESAFVNATIPVSATSESLVEQSSPSSFTTPENEKPNVGEIEIENDPIISAGCEPNVLECDQNGSPTGLENTETDPERRNEMSNTIDLRLEDRVASKTAAVNQAEFTFEWAHPGVIAGVVGGSVIALLFTGLLVVFVVYRLQRRDAGSYRLEDPRSSSGNDSKNSKSLAPLLPCGATVIGVDYGAAPMQVGPDPPVAPSMYVLGTKNGPLLNSREYFA